MNHDLSQRLVKVLTFSVVAQTSFIVLFVVNYGNLIVNSVTSLNFIPFFESLSEWIGSGTVSQTSPLHGIFLALSAPMSNAFATALMWSLLNGSVLVLFGISQYRR